MVHVIVLLQDILLQINMTMKNLPVSKKFYADIRSRILAALSFSPTAAEAALLMVDVFLSGGTPEEYDPAATLAFRMIKVELERAMLRSQRARERAKARKEKTVATIAVTPGESSVQASEVRLSRRERRALERSKRKRLKDRSLNPYRRNPVVDGGHVAGSAAVP